MIEDVAQPSIFFRAPRLPKVRQDVGTFGPVFPLAVNKLLSTERIGDSSITGPWC